MSDYQPEIGDLVDVSCQTYCGGQGSLHGIAPLLKGQRGVIEDVEAANVGDHIYQVRFRGPPESKGYRQGVRMYFKLSELEKVDRDVDTKPVNEVGPESKLAHHHPTNGGQKARQI